MSFWAQPSPAQPSPSEAGDGGDGGGLDRERPGAFRRPSASVRRSPPRHSLCRSGTKIGRCPGCPGCGHRCPMRTRAGSRQDSGASCVAGLPTHTQHLYPIASAWLGGVSRANPTLRPNWQDSALLTSSPLPSNLRQRCQPARSAWPRRRCKVLQRLPNRAFDGCAVQGPLLALEWETRCLHGPQFSYTPDRGPRAQGRFRVPAAHPPAQGHEKTHKRSMRCSMIGPRIQP